MTPSHLYPGGIPNLFGGGAGPAYLGYLGALAFVTFLAYDKSMESV